MSFPFPMPMLGKQVGAPAGLKVQDVFAVTLYTGNGSTQTVTTGVDLSTKGGMLWLKSRDGIRNHNIYDSTRGVQHIIRSNTTGVDVDLTGFGGVSAFSSTGFSVGSYAEGNASAENFLALPICKAAKFFDVVTYTGNGTTQAINHSLGATPGLIIVKQTDTARNWSVWHNSLTSDYYLLLNSTAAQASGGGGTVWGNNSTYVAPTSTQFTVGNSSVVNASGGTYVASLFAHDPDTTNGIIQCGSFFSASGSNAQTLGWEPAFLLFKSATSASGWVMVDQIRGWGAGNDPFLQPNNSNAEASADWGAPTSTGFTMPSASIGTGDTWIYMAIRKGPM